MDSQPHVIVGGPGTGKTTRLIKATVSYMLDHSLLPSDVAYMSFTRKGTAAGTSQIWSEWTTAAQVRGYVPSRDCPSFIFAATIHALTIRYKPMSLNGRDLLPAIGKEKREKIKTKDPSAITLFDMSTVNPTVPGFPQIKNRVADAVTSFDIRRHQYADATPSTPIVAALQKAKAKHSVIDFTDCLVGAAEDGWVIKSTKQNRIPEHLEGTYDYLPVSLVVVDECQDLTDLMWKLIRDRFPEGAHRIFAGDPDQSIYEHHGVIPDTFRTMCRQAEDAGALTVLTESHRLTGPMVKYARRFGTTKYSKTLRAVAEEPEHTQRDDQSIGVVDDRGLGALLNDGARIIEDLDIKHIRKTHVDITSSKPTIRDAPTAYIAATNHLLKAALRARLRAFRMPLIMQPWQHGRYVGESEDRLYWMLDRNVLLQYVRRAAGIPMMPKPKVRNLLSPEKHAAIRGNRNLLNITFEYEHMAKQIAARYRDEDTIQAVINMLYTPDDHTWLISTIHGVKGLEFDRVIINADLCRADKRSYFAAPDGGLPSGVSRMWYVGVTRARSALVIYQSLRAFNNGILPMPKGNKPPKNYGLALTFP